MRERPDLHRWARRTSEAIILTLVCLAPWAFGSVDSWAALAIDAGIFVVAVLGIVAGRAANRPREISFILPCLAILALAQAMPISGRLLGLIDPTTAGLRASAIPAVPERIIGDPAPPVAIPRPSVSLVPEESIHAAARLASAWILFLSVIGLGAGHPGMRRFAVVVSANAAALALFSLIQSLLWNGKIYGFRESPVASAWQTGGPFVGHSALAAYLNIGLGLGLGLLLSSRRSGRRGFEAWAVYAIGLILVGLVASHSRSGMIGAMAGATTVMVAMRRKVGLRTGLTVGAILLLAAVFLAILGGESSYRRAASIFEASSYTDRLEIWDAALRTWALHPLVGTGLGTFGIASAPAFTWDQGVTFVRAENEYLDILVEGGLIGLGLLLAGLVSLVRSALRALKSAPSPSELAMVVGGLFSLTTLAVQSLGDFSPHILGVALPAIVLCGHLRALGDLPATPVADPVSRRMGSALIRFGIAFLAFGILIHTYYRARSESRLAAARMPVPGAGSPESIPPGVPKETLETMRIALERALEDRPGWAEGHLRLGMVHLGLYERVAAQWIEGTVEDPELVRQLIDPLWLHATVHSAPADENGAFRDVSTHGPVKAHLIPAARCFLEARRCSPASAAPHHYLASLDFLLEGGGSTGDYASRALRLSGAEARLLMKIAQVAVQGGEPDLAALAWRRCIEVRESEWELAVDTAAVVLSADQILERVTPPGAQWPIRFADRLYKDPSDSETMSRYLEEALRRLPDDSTLTASERLRVEAVALAGLGDRERARKLWEAALAIEPDRAEWRKEMVGWLVDLGEIDAAHRHAVIGAGLDPENAGLRHALVTTAEMLARGRSDKP